MGTQEVLSVLSDPTRFDVLSKLASDGPASASRLAESLPVSRQAISKHLGVLEEAGLLARQRRGREIRYVFQPGPLEEVTGWVTQVGRSWDDRLQRLKDVTE